MATARRRALAPVRALRNQQRQVTSARGALANNLDEIERRLMPGNVGKVFTWWAKRQAKKHPVGWTIGGVVLGGLLIGLFGWAIVDDSDD